jgi:hypothetical protein
MDPKLLLNNRRSIQVESDEIADRNTKFIAQPVSYRVNNTRVEDNAGGASDCFDETVVYFIIELKGPDNQPRPSRRNFRIYLAGASIDQTFYD